MPLSGGLSAGIAAAGGVLDNLFNMGQGRKNRKFAEKMWNLQNEYNSPTQQMQRLKAAGLNPHLVYGNGATATSQSPVSMNNTEHTQSNFGEVASNYITNRLTARQEKNAIAQNDNINADTEKKRAETEQYNLLRDKIEAETIQIRQNTAKSKQEYDIIEKTKLNTIEQSY